MQAMALPDHVLKAINTIIVKKITNRRAFEKVRRHVICQDYTKGGLKMINVIDMQNSFLIQWVQKLFCNHSSVYTYIPNFY